MKATGIIRRIDDLGRVVIPKEIRRTMGIREGDPLEIYTDHGGCVIFKPYQNDELKPMAVSIVNTLRSYSNTRASVYDRYGHKLAGNGADSIDPDNRDECTFPIQDSAMFECPIGFIVVNTPPTAEVRGQIELFKRLATDYLS